MRFANAVRTLLLREQAPMPITRRKRANPPDQPENNNHNAEQTENAAETLVSAQAPTGPVEGDNAVTPTQINLYLLRHLHPPFPLVPSCRR